MKPIQILYITILVLIVACHGSLYGQKVCGGEILKVDYFPIEGRLFIDVCICRAQDSKASILFDWGDGTMDTLPRAASIFPDPDHVLDFYLGTHFYDSTINEYLIIRVLEEEVAEGFINIDYNEDRSFLLSDSILIYNEASIPHQVVNEGPVGAFGVLGIQNYGDPDPEILLTMFDGLFPGFGGDSLIYSIVPFPVEGSLPPAPPDEFHVDEYGLLLWDTPVEAGKYAVAAKVREMTTSTNPIYEEDKILFSTITRAFTIIVDSSDVVSTIGSPFETGIFSVYPNPSSEIVTLEYGGLSKKTQLGIYNMQGQAMYRQILNGTAALQRESIRVADWPAGIYLVEIDTDNGRVTKKMIVE
ncbi:MAG: T9SS type A sorting domain-containing protein [Bacteroidota bacterium]